LLVAFSLAAPLGASAQPRGLEVFPSDHASSRYREPGVRPGPSARDLYPSRAAVPEALGFVAPLSKDTESGRIGVAGWTAADLPTGSRGATDPDNTGWLGFGLAARWGSARPHAEKD
jgi:hypothetical protein